MPFELSRVRGLCFDVDGTISDTDDAWVRRLTRFLKPAGFLFAKKDPQRFSRWLVMVTESPLNLIYYRLDFLSLDDNFARLFDRIMRGRTHPPHPFEVMPGAPDLLASAADRYPLAVVSARDERSVYRFLDQFTLKHFFKLVIASQTCEHTKPYPDPVLYAAAMMNISPDQCVMIGDTTVDILAGKRAGAQTIGLLCGFGTEKELKRAGADLILNDLVELKAILDLN